jgi:hypothetical protein
MAGTVAQSPSRKGGAPSHESDSEELSGYSLLNVAEFLFPCLDAVAPTAVVEVGAYRGTLTAALLAWAQGSGAVIIAIDPEPRQELLALAGERPELSLVRVTSHEALAHLAPADAVILDGDHNYFTLSGELRLIAERSPDGALPLLLFHDVCWPHARRDTYYAPDRIPEEHRQPIARDAAIAPGRPGTTWAGLHYPYAAAREGGPRNGVLTAIEDFVSERDGLRLAIVPAFFGFGVLWREDAPYAQQLADLLDPYDRNPILERLEANRVAQMIDHVLMEHQQALMRSFLHSRAFALAEWISRLKQRGDPIFSRRKVKRVLGELDD